MNGRYGALKTDNDLENLTISKYGGKLISVAAIKLNMKMEKKLCPEFKAQNCLINVQILRMACLK